QDFLHAVRAQRKDDDLARALLFDQLQADLQGIPVEVTHLVFQPGLVQGFSIRRDGESQLHVRHPLDTDGDLHWLWLLAMGLGSGRRGKAIPLQDGNATRPPSWWPRRRNKWLKAGSAGRLATRPPVPDSGPLHPPPICLGTLDPRAVPPCAPGLLGPAFDLLG